MLSRLKWPVLFALVFVGSTISALLVGQWAEQRFFPVVEKFQVTFEQHTHEGLIISGSMDKVRQCRFVEVAAYAGAAYLSVDFPDRPAREIGKTRAEGEQAWGPWLITPDVEKVKLVVRHQCHALWDTVTVLLEP